MPTILAPTSSRPLGGSVEEFEGDGVKLTVRAFPREFWSQEEIEEFETLLLGLYLAEINEDNHTTSYTVVIDSYDLLHENVEEAVDVLNEAFDKDLEIHWHKEPADLRERVLRNGSNEDSRTERDGKRDDAITGGRGG